MICEGILSFMKACKVCGQLTDRYYSKRHKKCVECFNKVTNKKILEHFKPIVRKGVSDTIKFIFSNPDNKFAINDLLGCSHKKIKTHLESKFVTGMSWDNHGSWHVSHVRPFNSARTMRELKMLFRWQNLIPLWAEASLRKKGGIISDEKVNQINNKMEERYEQATEKLSNDIIKSRTKKEMLILLSDFGIMSMGDLERCAESVGYEKVNDDLWIKRRKL